jgi:hypothetical protein
MDILGAYDQLKACLEAQGIDVPIQDNLILKPRTLPAVVIEPVASLLLAHGYGSRFAGEHQLCVWVIVPVLSGTLREAYAGLIPYVEKVLATPRFYAVSNSDSETAVEYGVDLIWGSEVVFAKVVGKVA